MWPFDLSVRLPIVGLVSRYLTNCLIGREAICKRISPLTCLKCLNHVLCGIIVSFPTLSPSYRQVPHVLLTRPPLCISASCYTPFDLNVLCTPPAFILSQDQTLKCLYIFNNFTQVFVRILKNLRTSSSAQSSIYLDSKIFS